MARSIRSSAILVLAAALLGAVVARPPAEAQTAAERKKAKAHFKRGKGHQDAGRYAEAVVAYEQAYALVPEPELLFNIGQAHRLAGERKKAVEAYRRYLAAEPNGRGAAQAKGHVERLSRELEAEEARRRDEEARRRDGAAPPPPPPDPEPQAETIDDASAGSGLRWSGLGVAALGVVGLGLGAYFELRILDLEEEGNALIAGGMDPDRVAEIEREGEAAERNMIISFVAGGAAIVTGGILYWLGARDAEAAVAAAPGEGHIVVRLRF